MEAAVYWAIASMVVSVLAAYTNRPKNQTPAPTAFKDIEFPQAEEGTPQCVIFGDCWVTDWTVLDVGEYITEPY